MDYKPVLTGKAVPFWYPDNDWVNGSVFRSQFEQQPAIQIPSPMIPVM